MVALVLHDPTITQQEMALSLRWRVAKVKYYIEKLRQRNVNTRVGSSQKGRGKFLRVE